MASCRREPARVREEPPARKQVGPYEIDRLLGRGGMGAVYLAHRADGHFEQKVAIKLIDRPFETELFRERFRQERQILAGLQHPYIARLLDGGVTAEGELYLVMEYVDGVPIHRFCQERRLTQTQRIELFLRVCEAVQFAHQNFVVHRDLKPDNILVAEDGTPRLLDFGTAKLLSPSLDGTGEPTNARRLSVLYSAVRQPGAGVRQSHHHGIGHLLAGRAFISSADRNAALRIEGANHGARCCARSAKSLRAGPRRPARASGSTAIWKRFC